MFIDFFQQQYISIITILNLSPDYINIDTFMARKTTYWSESMKSGI
jgi:hypothetical protein